MEFLDVMGCVLDVRGSAIFYRWMVVFASMCLRGTLPKSAFLSAERNNGDN